MTKNFARCISIVLLISLAGLTACGASTPAPAPTAHIEPTAFPQLIPTVIEVTATPAAAQETPIDPAAAGGPLQETAAQSTGGEEPVEGWVGAVVSNPPGAQFDDYFQMLDQEGSRFGIDGADDSIRQQLATYRASGATIKVWGTLYRNVMDAYETQLVVTRLEEYKP